MRNNIFVIVNYNDFENTFKLINNIIEYKSIDQIIIVDNCSKDDSYEQLVKIKNKKIIIIKNNKNKGYGSAINTAIKYVEKEIGKANLIVSNSDIIIKEESYLKKLMNDIEKDDIGIIVPIINEHNEKKYGWKIPTIRQSLILNIPVINKKYEKEKILYKKNDFKKEINEIESFSGCFFITKTEVMKEINYFDENLFLYYEENTIAQKLKKTKYKIMLDKGVEIIHNHSLTINKSLNEYNKLKELKKSQEYYYKNVVKSNKILLFLLILGNKIILTVKKVKVGTKN